MENIYLLILAGFIIGTFGTLIGAGGGFILVPLLILFYPDLSPEIVTAISIAVVAVNAISGSFAYANSGRIDYKAGVVFALFTIPGSILGVLVVQYVPQKLFNIIFGILLIVLSGYLFYKNRSAVVQTIQNVSPAKGLTHRQFTDKTGNLYKYSYNQRHGVFVSVVVGFLSPLLGIGGGIIHVPAMVNWLRFPVHIATATSQFILAVMATVSVVVHAINGTYDEPSILNMIFFLCLGVIPGAQLGAYLSRRLKSQTIIKVLACGLVLVGVRIFLKSV